MSPAEARMLFSDAHDGELDAETRAALDAALAADPSLAEEYAAFGRMLSLAREQSPLPVRPDGGEPNLLPAVQRALRQRSRGRFYPDRFSERRGALRLTPWLLSAALLLLLFVLFAAVHLFAAVR
jgi:anti-sigma factor RsiW